jgi:hypothetical protein
MKQLKEYPQYSIGTDGTVVSNKFQEARILKPQLVTQSKKKYLAVGLYNGTNRRSVKGQLVPHMRYIHRLVWEAYMGDIPPHLEIEHKDQNPHNCSLENLKLVSRQENIDSHFRDKNGYVYADKRNEFIKDYLDLKSYQKVADKWGCNVGTIYRIIKNKKIKIVDGKSTIVDAGTCDDFYTQQDLRFTGTRKELGMNPAYTYKKKKK